MRANLQKISERANAQKIGLYNLEEICEEIERNKLFFVWDSARNRAQCLIKNSEYIGQRSYILIKLGFFRPCKNSDFSFKLNKYCPSQSISAALARFLDECKAEGIYKGSLEGSKVRGRDFALIEL